MVNCQQGTQKYLLETVGKGFYEVIGTLGADGTISEMSSVYMGENLGAPPAAPPTSPPPLSVQRASVFPNVCFAQTPRCTSKWSS